MEINSVLNNREIAVAIWLLIAFLWALSLSSVRHSIPDILKTLVGKYIIIPFTIMILYVLLIVLIFKILGFWDTSAIKGTILWTIGTASVTFFSLNNVARDKAYFKKTVLDNFKFVVILEFLVGLYTFNLITELIIVPVVTFMVMWNAIEGSKPDNKQVSKILNSALGIIGLVLIVITLRKLSTDQNFATLQNLKDFLLPPFFTIAFLPFVYLMVLYLRHESRKKKRFKHAGA